MPRPRCGLEKQPACFASTSFSAAAEHAVPAFRCSPEPISFSRLSYKTANPSNYLSLKTKRFDPT